MVDTNYFPEYNRNIIIESDRVLLNSEKCNYSLQMYKLHHSQIIGQSRMHQSTESYTPLVAHCQVYCCCLWNHADGSSCLSGRCYQVSCGRADSEEQNIPSAAAWVYMFKLSRRSYWPYLYKWAPAGLGWWRSLLLWLVWSNAFLAEICRIEAQLGQHQRLVHAQQRMAQGL